MFVGFSLAFEDSLTSSAVVCCDQFVCSILVLDVDSGSAVILVGCVQVLNQAAATSYVLAAV